MATTTDPIRTVYEGWDGYQTSIVNAVEPLTAEQLNWRPTEKERSVGEVVRHLALGRIDWLYRVGAIGIQELVAPITAWDFDPAGNRYIQDEKVVAADEKVALLDWLGKTWGVIDTTIKTWTVDDLSKTYRHVWRGTTWAVSRQWTLWRVMAHDIHHGGELSLMLGMQGIEPFELSALGGHIIEPAKMEE